MKSIKKITTLSLALALPLATVTPSFAAENSKEPISVSTPVELTKDAKLAMQLLDQGVITDLGEESLYKNSDDFETVVYEFNSLANGDVQILAAGFDGQWTNSWTVPKGVINAGAMAVTTYLATTLGAPLLLATFLGGLAGNYAVTKNIKFTSTVKYRWVTKYTKCYYESSTKIYVDGTYKKTVSKNWTAEVDTNTD